MPETKKINFVASLSGDYECFCFAVIKDDYKRITGKNPDKYAKNTFHKGLYNIYPNDIFGPSSQLIDVEIKWEVLSEKKLKPNKKLLDK